MSEISICCFIVPQMSFCNVPWGTLAVQCA